MTYWVLLAIAGFLTLLSLRHHNILFSLSGMLGWIGVWAYNLNYPPTNITVGTFMHDVLTYTYIMMAIAVMYIFFRGRRSRDTITSVGAVDGKIMAHTSTQEERGETTAEYRQKVRKAPHPNRRGR